MFFKRKSKRSQSDQDQPSIARDIRVTRRAGIRTAILVTLLVSGVVPAICMLLGSNDSGVPFSEYLYQMWSIALLTYPLTIVVALLTVLRKQRLLTFSNLFLTISIVIFCGAIGHAIGFLSGHETARPANANANAIASQPIQSNAASFQIVGFQRNIQQDTAQYNGQQAGQGAGQTQGFVQPNSLNSLSNNSNWNQQPQAQPQFNPTAQNGSTQFNSNFNSAVQSNFNAHSQPNPQVVTAAAATPKSERGILLGLPGAFFGFFLGYYKAYGFRVFVASLLVGMFAGNTANRFLVHVPKNRRETMDLAGDLVRSRNELTGS